MASKNANLPAPSIVTGSFAFTVPRPGNLSDAAVDGAAVNGAAVLCDVPVCSTPLGAVGANATVTCSYVCAPDAVTVRPHFSMDGVQFSGTQQNVSYRNASDAATNCVRVAVPLFAGYALAWVEPWSVCASNSKTVVTTLPLPGAGECPSFEDNYMVTAMSVTRQGTAPGEVLSSSGANARLACPLPSISGTAGYTVTSSYNWCAWPFGIGGSLGA